MRMFYFLAFLPILLILVLMAGFRWSGQKAGPVGWVAGVVIAIFVFGMNWQVFWVSQYKGLLISVYVLLVLWPALLLYFFVNQFGGIKAIAEAMQRSVRDHQFLAVLIAWSFAGMLEGVTGFGVPVAIVAPILVGMGITPILAVTAAAIGHSWAVTFGGMGLTYQTLISVSQMEPAAIIPPIAFLLGIACVFTGLAASMVMGAMKIWHKVVITGLVISGVQYFISVAGFPQLAGFLAGAVGVFFGWLISRAPRSETPTPRDPRLIAALAAYGGLVLLNILIGVPGPLNILLDGFRWQILLPGTLTATGFAMAPAKGQLFRFILHPAFPMLIIIALTYFGLRRSSICKDCSLRAAWDNTLKIALPATVGIIFTIGLATMMEYSRMTLLLAEGLSALMQSAYPLTAAYVGVLGAFATGSNNNSNVLFVPLQKAVAILLGFAPAWLVAAQTAGGAIGAMVAPAKLIVGVSTVGLLGKEGDVLRKTLPYVLILGALLGILAYFMVQL
jgi:lactate permease